MNATTWATSSTETVEKTTPTNEKRTPRFFQPSLLIELEKLDWGSVLDNKSDGHAR
jgi:hypothetical protein